MPLLMRNLRTNEVHQARLSFAAMVAPNTSPVVKLIDNGEPIDPDGWAVDQIDDDDREIIGKMWRLPSPDRGHG